MKALFALLVAGTLMIPEGAAALEKHGSVRAATSKTIHPQAAWDKLPLPPIPYLDTIPWLEAAMNWRGPQVDAWLHSSPPALPFMMQTASPAPQVFSEFQALERSTTR